MYEDVNGNDIHTMNKRTFNLVACGCSLNENCFCASIAVNRLHDHVAGKFMFSTVATYRQHSVDSSYTK